MRRIALSVLVSALAASCVFVARTGGSSEDSTMETTPKASKAHTSAPSTSAGTPGPSGPRNARVKASDETRKDDVLTYEATETTLSNGLKVIVVPTGMPNLVSLQIPVQTGSRNEVEAGKTGFAHFFEHMMFRGSKRFPLEVREQIATAAGARTNAYTTDDFTNYHMTFAKEDLEKILEIEGDRFQHLQYTEEQFKTESRAVLGEYNKNSANPSNKLEEVTQEVAFDVHTYKHTTMGFLADIEQMPNQIEYARTFFDRWYRPEYATVMLVGDVDPKTAIPLVEKHFGQWQRGSYTVDIPQEPAHDAPRYVHQHWESPTAPLVWVSFHGPAFSESQRDSVALDLLQELYFGSTSELYAKLVLDEQKVDDLSYYTPASQDPSLAVIAAQLRDPKDAVYVRDQILATCVRAREEGVDPARLAQAKANNRYGIARALDNTETIASVLARYVRFRRSYDTFNNLFRLYDAVTPEDCLAAAEKYYRDERLVVSTLSHEPMAPEIATQPPLASFRVGPPKRTSAPVVELVNPSRQLTFKLQFLAGSADDPQGREGLAAVSAAMIADAGSSEMKIDEIQKVLFPIAGGFSGFVDRETTTFNGSIHADNLGLYFDTVLPQLLSPGWREEDFTRVKQQVRNALVQDLRTNNDEELGKEALQSALFAGSGYGHPSQGTVEGIDAITLDDVKQFVATRYTQASLVIGIAGSLPADGKERLLTALGRLPLGAAPAKREVGAHRPQGIEVDILQKETRATAISIGHPLDVLRGDPDFVALYLARTWLGEHRSSMSRLYQRIREIRGMNYGDYAYIEAFRGGMFQFFPGPNQARAAQLFEIWIRPVKPEHAHHAIRIALHETDQLISNGLSKDDFERVREYLSKNVFLMTASQPAQLGYALDSRFYGTPEYTQYMRDGLSKLTLEQVNAAMKKHWSVSNVRIVCVTKDAEGLKQQLLSDAPSSIAYDSQKSPDLLEEDQRIGARKLGISPDELRVIPIEEVFRK
jgi:zinc protease